MNRMARCVVGILTTLAIALPGIASAQEQKRLGVYKYWSAFTTQSDNGKVCWIATAPVDSSYTGGNRGEVFLMVSIYPQADLKGEVSIISGYAYDEKKTVQAKIGDKPFSLFAIGDAAWLETRREESAMVGAMRAGLEATVTGYSSSGGQSTDNFSLLGFTAAYNAASKACS